MGNEQIDSMRSDHNKSLKRDQIYFKEIAVDASARAKRVETGSVIHFQLLSFAAAADALSRFCFDHLDVNGA